MSPVEVRQIGHVASAPVVETFSSGGRTENKALITVISNTRWKDREGNVRSKATAILWTLWAKAAVNASWYLDVGARWPFPGRWKVGTTRTRKASKFGPFRLLHDQSNISTPGWTRKPEENGALT